MVWWYGAVARLIARGYVPLAAPRPQEDWHVPLPSGVEPGLIAFCPTFVGADNSETQAAILGEIAEQLREGMEAGALPACVLVVGMQHRQGEAATCQARLAALRQRLAPSGVAFAAFGMAEYGKVKSVNVALRIARERGAALLQIDDDIQIKPGCVVALYRAYAEHGGGLAVGATKVGLSRQNRASKVLRWIKGQTKAATNYPHACCMIIDPALLPEEGIPSRYISDDGYICFSLLRPKDRDALRLLRLVPEAVCVHYVGGPAGQSLRRIRRMLLNHHVYMADFPAEVGRYYFRNILFPGFWPLGKRPERFAPLRWSLHFLYFLAFAVLGLELITRGMLGRPLRRIEWAGFDDRQRPTLPEEAAAKEHGL